MEYDKTQPAKYNWREQIRKELKDRNITYRSFQRRSGIQHTHISDMINGKKPLSVRFAVALEFFGIGSAQTWLTYKMKEDVFNEKQNWNF